EPSGQKAKRKAGAKAGFLVSCGWRSELDAETHHDAVVVGVDRLRSGTGVQRHIAEVGIAVLYATEDVLGHLHVRASAGRPAPGRTRSRTARVGNLLLRNGGTARRVDQQIVARSIAEAGPQRALEAVAEELRAIAGILAIVANVSLGTVHESAALPVVTSEAAEHPAGRAGDRAAQRT